MEKLKERTEIIWNWFARRRGWCFLILGGIFLFLLCFANYKSVIQNVYETPYAETGRAYIAITAGFFCFLLLFIIILWKKHVQIERLFVIAVSVLGIVYMVMLPPFTSPDESRHFVTAYQISNQMMFQEPSTGEGVLVRAEDNNLPSLSDVSLKNYQYIIDNFCETCSDETVVEHWENPVKFSPFPYVPQAVGITLARILHLGAVPLMFAGRFMNLLCYIVIVYFAIRCIPFGKSILFLVSVLPMTLEQVSSLSYDALIVAMAMFLTAYILDLVYEKEKVMAKDIVIITVMSVILAPCKIVYFPLLGLCFLIPIKKFGSIKRYIRTVCLVAGATIAALLLFNFHLLAAPAEGPTYIPWAGVTGYTLGELLHAPKKLLLILFNTVFSLSSYYFSTMLGSSLGRLQVGIPDLYLAVFTVLLVLAALQEENGKCLSGKGKIWISVLAGAGAFLILFSLLLEYTPCNSKVVSGVQGRYYLPWLPILLLCLRNKRISIRQNVDKLVIGGSLVINFLVVQQIAEYAVQTFLKG